MPVQPHFMYMPIQLFFIEFAVVPKAVALQYPICQGAVSQCRSVAVSQDRSIAVFRPADRGDLARWVLVIDRLWSTMTHTTSTQKFKRLRHGAEPDKIPPDQSTCIPLTKVAKVAVMHGHYPSLLGSVTYFSKPYRAGCGTIYSAQ